MIRVLAVGVPRDVYRQIVGSDRQMARFVLDAGDGTTLRCVAWGQVAEAVPDEGRIIVMGRMATRSWTNQDGQERSTTEVTVQELDIIEGPDDAAEPF